MYTTRPELESQRAMVQLEALHSDGHHRRSEPTSVDLLEVYDQHSPRVFYQVGIQHDALVAHALNVNGVHPSPKLRILFIDTNAGIHLTTLSWLRDRFNVAPIYLDHIAIKRYTGRIGNGLFTERDREGSTTGLSGFYQCSTGMRSGPISLWFRYDQGTQSSTYVISRCPQGVQNAIVSCAQGPDPHNLCRPLYVDALLLEECSRAWTDAIATPRLELLTYEEYDASTPLSPDETTEAISSLHAISQLLNVIHLDIADLEDRAEYLLGVLGKFQTGFMLTAPGNGMDESILYTLSRSRIWNRWVENYIERTKIRIDLFFNLAAQSDNRTNLEIANLTSEIAVQTQMDSTSMITMATVTMFFLPATFVCAFFSMVFFNYGIDADGRASFVVSPVWWYFVVVTIPLTIAVFIVWGVWQRMRLSRNGARDMLTARRNGRGGVEKNIAKY